VKAGDAWIVVASGPPLIDPGGIVVANSGDIYVADSTSPMTGLATIFKIAKGQTTAVEFVSGIAIGYPVGISIDMKNTTLVISGRNPTTRMDAIIRVDLTTKDQTLYTGNADTDISLFEEAAGMHRARNKDIFAWADSKAKANPAQAAAGSVFTIVF
jgi:hypothetical protein